MKCSDHDLNNGAMGLAVLDEEGSNEATPSSTLRPTTTTSTWSSRMGTPVVGGLALMGSNYHANQRQYG